MSVQFKCYEIAKFTPRGFTRSGVIQTNSFFGLLFEHQLMHLARQERVKLNPPARFLFATTGVLLNRNDPAFISLV